MIIPKRIKIENLGSISEYIRDFEKEVTLIQGLNLDDKGQESNGSGKSLPIEAIAIALTGAPIRKGIRLVDLIKRGKDSSTITLECEDLRDSSLLKIIRKLHTKNSMKIEIWKGDKELGLSGVTEYQNKIYELLDINEDDLLNYFIIDSESSKPFLMAGDSEKKKIISRFSGAFILNGIDKTILSTITPIEQKLSKTNTSLIQLQSKIEVYEEQINEIKETNSLESKTERIQVIENKTKTLNSEIEEIEKQKLLIIPKVERLKSERALLEKDLEIERVKLKAYPNDQDFLDKIKHIDEEEKEVLDTKKLIEEEKDRLSKEITPEKKTLTELENKLLGLISCPKCKHEFLTSDKDFNAILGKETADKKKTIISNLEIELKDVEKDGIDIEADIKSYSTKKATIRESLNKQQQEKHLIERAILKINGEITLKETEITKVSQSDKTLDESIKDKELSILDNQNKIDIIRTEEIEEKIKSINLKIEETKTQIKIESKVITQLNQEKYEEEQWITNFQRFNTYLANKAISSIEGYTNYALEQMKSDLQIMIEGYRTLADGKTVRENIDVIVLRNGEKLGPLGTFSKGEKARIIVASILALQKLICLNSKSGGFGYIGMDEVLNMLDSKGIKSIAESLRGIPLTIDLITHGSHHMNNIKTLTFTKEHGETKIL